LQVMASQWGVRVYPSLAITLLPGVQACMQKDILLLLVCLGFCPDGPPAVGSVVCVFPSSLDGVPWRQPRHSRPSWGPHSRMRSHAHRVTRGRLRRSRSSYEFARHDSSSFSRAECILCQVEWRQLVGRPNTPLPFLSEKKLKPGGGGKK
jgi:hypothetical protein